MFAHVQHGHRPDRGRARPDDAAQVMRCTRAAGEPGAATIGDDRATATAVVSYASDAPVSRPRTARRLGVLISGRGSNLQALIDADRATGGSTRASPSSSRTARTPAGSTARRARRHRDAGARPPRLSRTRDDFDRAARAGAARARRSRLVCLAGFMRLVGAPLLDAFPNAILNVHPSLLPAFPGVDAQRQALDHGVKVTGATVHLVTASSTPARSSLQAAVPVLDDDTVETLSARILVEEHRIYPAGRADCARRRLARRRPPIHALDCRLILPARRESAGNGTRVAVVGIARRDCACRNASSKNTRRRISAAYTQPRSRSRATIRGPTRCTASRGSSRHSPDDG